MRTWIMPLVVLLGAGVVFLLTREPERSVVLYCAVDQDQSRPVAEAFSRETGLTVTYEGEDETRRSIGLFRRILEERDAPRADVFWNNEIMTTVHLGLRDALAPLPEGLAAQFPAKWRDPDGRFVAFGARVRVLLVNTELLPDPADHPDSVEDLLDPRYAERGLKTCLAKPETGTTYTHAVVLLTRDEIKGKAFFEALAEARRAGRVVVVGGNGPSMQQARDASNRVAFALTDTDDAKVAIDSGAPVKVVFPDQGEGQPGALVIPNTAALVRRAPHKEAAERLLRYLVSAENEAALARGPSAQVPLRDGVTAPAGVRLPDRTMEVDWAAVGRNRDTWREWLDRTFRPAD